MQGLFLDAAPYSDSGLFSKGHGANISRRSGPAASPANANHDRVAGSVLNSADAGCTLNIQGADAMQTIDPVSAWFLRRRAGS